MTCLAHCCLACLAHQLAFRLVAGRGIRRATRDAGKNTYWFLKRTRVNRAYQAELRARYGRK